MFELVKALNDGAGELKKRSSNPIGLNAGCELFIAFVTLFPHDSAVNFIPPPFVTLFFPKLSWQSFSELKTELVRQGQNYARDALTFRMKIAELALGFIKDDSVVSTISIIIIGYTLTHVWKDPHPFLFTSSDENSVKSPRAETNLRLI
jgi:translation initiation factor eIF-2B subunit alpha